MSDQAYMLMLFIITFSVFAALVILAFYAMMTGISRLMRRLFGD